MHTAQNYCDHLLNLALTLYMTPNILFQWNSMHAHLQLSRGS